MTTSVAQVFERKRCQVSRAQDICPGATDQQLAAIADQMGVVLVTANRRDFNKILARKPPTGNQQQYRRAGCILIGDIKPARMPLRIEQVFEAIEFEAAQCEKSRDARLFVEVLVSKLIIHR